MLSKYILHLLLIALTLGVHTSANAIVSARAVSSCDEYANGLKVSFLNVGQGDALLIRCPDQKTQTLLDSGPANKDYSGAEEMFARALEEQMAGDHVIEFAINTHPHNDHISGFLSLLEAKGADAVKIKTYVDSGADNPVSRIEERVRAKVKEAGTTYISLAGSRGASLQVCPAESTREGINLLLNQPQAEGADLLGCPNNLNDCSLISRMKYQGVSFLFLADVSTNWEKVALKRRDLLFPLKSTVLKIGHHGNGSTSAALLDAVRPDLLVLSTGSPGHGMTERYGFPADPVISRVRRHASRGPKFPGPGIKLKTCSRTYDACLWEERDLPNSVWSTALSGTINVYAKNGKFCVEGEKINNRFEVVP
jgi:beta-lactamase superfamily II metal-dependent hydrolase